MPAPTSSPPRRWPRWRWFVIAGVALTLLTAGVLAAAWHYVWRPTPWTAGPLLVLKKNGGWCWFQDPRVLVVDGAVLVGTVAGKDEHGSDSGDIEIGRYVLDGGARTSFKLHPRLETDDHDSPALSVLPDGRFLAVYTKHSRDPLVRWRISKAPGSIDEWEDERTVDVGGNATYSNTFLLSSKPDRLYNFHRGFGANPNVVLASTIDVSFRYAGRLFAWDLTPATGADPVKLTGVSQQPKSYVQYASNGVDKIHFTATECHPRCYDNSVYHGYVHDDAVYDSHGAQVDANLLDQQAAPVTKLTRVYEGSADAVPWTMDLELDRDGKPYLIFSVQKDDAPNRHYKSEDGGYDNRYFYARFDGEQWNVHEMAYAGTRLYAREHHYTGLGALHPFDPDTVFISTNADPVTGAPLVSATDKKRHYEIFRGRTKDGGATWRWEALTKDSRTDNIRPVVPKWEGGTLVTWLRGRYRSMAQYDLDVVALLNP